MKLGLNLKLSLFVGMMVFIVAFSVGEYANYTSTQQLKVKANEHLYTVAKNVNDVLDREMLERYREMRFVSNSSVLTSKNSTIQEKKEYIQRVKDGQKHHEWIGYALPDGTVQVGSNGYLEGKNVKARPWHPAGLKAPYIGDVHDALLLARLLPNTSGEAIYFTDVAFPVISKDNETLGVICTHLTWQWTRDIIRSIQKEKGVDIFLLSKDGLVLVGPNNTERKNISEISPQVANSFLSTDKKYDTLTWDNGTSYLTATSVSEGLEDYQGFSWRVIVRQDSNTAFKEISKNSNNILVFSLSIAVIGAFLSILFSNWLILPIKNLTNLINERKSNKNIKIPKTNSNDELGKLQNTLATLSENLQNEHILKKDAQEKVQIALKIFEQSVEGIIVTDAQNKIILVNKEFTNITGYTIEDVIGKNPKILASGIQDDDFYEKMWNDILTKKKWTGKIKNRKKDGTEYEESLKISPLTDENGKILYYIATFIG